MKQEPSMEFFSKLKKKQEKSKVISNKIEQPEGSTLIKNLHSYAWIENDKLFIQSTDKGIYLDGVLDNPNWLYELTKIYETLLKNSDSLLLVFKREKEVLDKLTEVYKSVKSGKLTEEKAKEVLETIDDKSSDGIPYKAFQVFQYFEKQYKYDHALEWTVETTDKPLVFTIPKENELKKLASLMTNPKIKSLLDYFYNNNFFFANHIGDGDKYDEMVNFFSSGVDGLYYEVSENYVIEYVSDFFLNRGNTVFMPLTIVDKYELTKGVFYEGYLPELIRFINQSKNSPSAESVIMLAIESLEDRLFELHRK